MDTGYPNHDETFSCPYCGSENTLFIEFSGSSRQNFVHDCETCCKPILVHLKIRGTEIVELYVQRENE